MKPFNLVILSALVAMGVGFFLVNRAKRLAGPGDSKPTRQRVLGRVLLTYAYAMLLVGVVLMFTGD